MAMGPRTEFDGSLGMALSCAAALRVGGAVFILAEAAGLGDLYYVADAGLRAGERAAGGRALNAQVVQAARKAQVRLLSRSASMLVPEFAGAALLVLGLTLDALAEGAAGSSLAGVLASALDAAAQWPGHVDLEEAGSLSVFERFCQEEASAQLSASGAAGLKSVTGTRELQYRRLAQAFR